RTRPLIYFRPTCSQSRGRVPTPPCENRVCRGFREKVPNESKMPCRCDMGQYQSRCGIYLVDNKQGGDESASPDVYCAELELFAGILKLFLKPRRSEKLRGRLLIGGIARTPFIFLP